MIKVIKNKNDRDVVADYIEWHKLADIQSLKQEEVKGNVYFWKVKIPRRKVLKFFPGIKITNNLEKADLIICKTPNVTYGPLTKETSFFIREIFNKHFSKLRTMEDSSTSLPEMTFEQFLNIEPLTKSYDKSSQILALKMCSQFKICHKVTYIIDCIDKIISNDKEIIFLYERFFNVNKRRPRGYISREEWLELYIKDPSDGFLKYIFNKHYNCKLSLVED